MSSHHRQHAHALGRRSVPGRAPGSLGGSVGRSGWRRRGFAIVALCVAQPLLGCSMQNPAVPPGPPDPYSQDAPGSDSVVRPASTLGDVAVVATGLQQAGFFCAEVRSDGSSRQTWCRAVEVTTGATDVTPMTTVDIVSTPDGRLQYVGINLPAEEPAIAGWNADARLVGVLEASVFRLWPADAADVAGAISEVRSAPTRDGADDQHPPRRAALETDRADYFIGEGTEFHPGAEASEREPLTFVAATDLVVDTWPSSSQHSLTSAAKAAPALEANGFDCYGEFEMPCVLPGTNQQIDYATVGGFERVVAVNMFIRGGTSLDGTFLTLADSGLPEGLPFLTEPVKPAVEAKVDQVRRNGESFIGIVEGALVIIDTTPRPSGVEQDWAVPVRLSIGAPLVTRYMI